MKRFSALLTAALVAGFCLAACGNLVTSGAYRRANANGCACANAGQPNGGRFAHGEG